MQTMVTDDIEGQTEAGNSYYSERLLGARPRIDEIISAIVWGGIVSTIEALVADDSFENSFPSACPDGCGVSGANANQFSLSLAAEVPGISWPLNTKELPPALSILDLLEFCHRHVAKVIKGSYHSFFQHYHLTFDQGAGQAAFRGRINRIFGRNGVAFEFKSNGQITRLGPEVLRESLQTVTFKTGDTELDSLLETARSKFLSPDPKLRRESLEKLWDGWERLKTLEPGKDKRASVKNLLDAAAGEPKFRDLLEREAKELTEIGNTFQIRHTETTQTQVEKDLHVDYLFHRLFSMIRMLVESKKHSPPATAILG